MENLNTDRMPDDVKPASVGVLLDMVKADIERAGSTSSFMVRAGLMLDILNELFDHRRYRNAALRPSPAPSEQTTSIEAEGYARGVREAAKVAREWKSPLRPGAEARLLGHQEASRSISEDVLALLKEGR